jgi:DNA-3-methyladenine glycosylase I
MKPLDDVPCGWAPMKDKLYRDYHDTEWGVPVRDARALWEKFQLDGFQAGLSWITILRKRDAMREEFDDFDPARIVRWKEARVAKALENAGVIRSPTKINAMISNARIYLDMQDKGEDFSDYVWSYVGNKPKVNRLDHWKNVKPTSSEGDALSKDMKKRGYKFCGPVIVYAAMQAVGLVNDHEVSCPRHKAVQKL